ncbi:MAG: acetyl-CoA carboxylase biotin carboxyl carrier protein [Candidatus Omnitrophota bacterium]
MNLKEIKEMITLMNENDLNEIEIERDGLKIKLKKTHEHTSEVIMERVMPSQTRQPQAPVGIENAAKEAAEKRLVEIKAPIVGTFYRASSPEAEAFVEIGQEIEVGQVVCIIEAMKLMNEIKSEVRGKIIDILAENADPVEYGQILFLIEPY